MYQQHFGLDRPPFKITPDTSLFFEGKQRGAVLEALCYAIESGAGIIKVVGEVGSGKTMLCRMLELQLRDSAIDVVYIANPSFSPDNILHIIAHELQLDVSHDVSKVDVMQKIQAHLLRKHAENQQVVLFVEEAQSMPVETLEEIRLLSNLETDQNKLLQMVLFGQPELDEKLAQASIRQLKERITHSFYLAPFQPEDTLQYLNFRLRSVGYRGPDIFTKKTAATVKKYSTGLIRRINILADKALLAAYAEGSHSVTAKHIKSAAVDSEFTAKNSKKKVLWIISAIAIIIIVLFLGFIIGQAQSPGSLIATKVKAENIQPPLQQKQQHKTRVKEIFSTHRLQSSARLAMKNRDKYVVQRQQATRVWLSRARDNHFSIQLFMARTSDQSALETFLHKMPLTLVSKIYIYETRVNGRSWYSVLYDEFNSQKSAISALKQMPVSMLVSSPYPRRISAIKKDL